MPPPVMVAFEPPLKVNVELAVAVKVPALLSEPPILNLSLAEMERVPPELTVRLVHTALVTFTVTLKGLGIVTLSAAVGTLFVDQVLVAFQLPVLMAEIFAAKAENVLDNNSNAITNTR